MGRDGLAILASWARRPGGWRVAGAAAVCRPLGAGQLPCPGPAVRYSPPACPGARPGGSARKPCRDWELCLRGPGAAAAQGLDTRASPPGLHHTLPGRGLAALRTDSKPTRSSSVLGTWGQCPSALNHLLGPSSGTVWRQPMGTERTSAGYAQVASGLQRGGQESDVNVQVAPRMGQDERPGGSSLKQEWQVDFVLRADLDQLLRAPWGCGQTPSRLQPASVL